MVSSLLYGRTGVMYTAKHPQDDARLPAPTAQEPSANIHPRFHPNFIAQMGKRSPQWSHSLKQPMVCVNYQEHLIDHKPDLAEEPWSCTEMCRPWSVLSFNSEKDHGHDGLHAD